MPSNSIRIPAGLCDAAEVANLLQAGHSSAGGQLWTFTRERQRADMESASQGLVTQAQLSWFSGGRARATKVHGAPH